MSENKKYFYLKLKDTFFDSEEMKILESQKNGVSYQNLYLKMCLLSVKNNGRLAFKDSLPYDVDMLSTVLRVSIDTVKTGIEMFSRLRLVDILDNGEMYMSDIQSLIGHGSSEAERIAKYRAVRKTDAQESVTLLQDCHTVCTPELELDTELQKEKDCAPNKSSDRGAFYSHLGKPTPKHIVDMVKNKKGE